MDFRDVSRVAGLVSIGGILASGIVAVQSTAATIAAQSSANTIATWIASNTAALAGGLSSLPLVGECAAFIGSAFSAHLLLGVGVIVGMAIAIPWALDTVGKLLDGMMTKTSNAVDRLKIGAENEKYRLQARSQARQPVISPSQPLAEYSVPNRDVSHAQSYLEQKQHSQLAADNYQGRG